MYYVVKVNPQARNRVKTYLQKKITLSADSTLLLPLENNPIHDKSLLFLYGEKLNEIERILEGVPNCYGLLSSVPITEDEYQSYTNATTELKPPLAIGDNYIIKEGPFKDLSFTLHDLDKEVLIGEVNIFGSFRKITIPNTSL